MIKENFYRIIKSNPNNMVQDLCKMSKVDENEAVGWLYELKSENKIKFEKRRGWKAI